jgi:hypothetical protein
LKRAAHDSKEARDRHPPQNKHRSNLQRLFCLNQRRRCHSRHPKQCLQMKTCPWIMTLHSICPRMIQNLHSTGSRNIPTFDALAAVAWKERHPPAKSLVKKVCFLPMNKSPLAAPHCTIAAPVIHQQDRALERRNAAAPPPTQVGDIQLDSGHNVPINCSLVIGNRAGGMLLPALDSRP